MALVHSMFVLFLVLLLSSASVYYVSAPNGTSCPDGNDIVCHNLSFYIRNTYFNDHTIFYFMEGTHTMEDNIIIDTYMNVSLQSFPNLNNTNEQNEKHRLVCNDEEIGINIINSSNVLLKGLTILSCEPTSISAENVCNLTLESMNIIKAVPNQGFVLFSTNTFILDISYSTFKYGRLYIEYNTKDTESAYCSNTSFETVVFTPKLTIQNSQITLSQSLNGGLNIEVYQDGVTIVLDHVTAYNNTTPNMAIVVSELIMGYNIQLSNIIASNALQTVSVNSNTNTLLPMAGGLTILRNIKLLLPTECNTCIVNITNSNISYNANGGILLAISAFVYMDSCSITGNNHSGLWIQPLVTSDDYHPFLALQQPAKFYITNVTVQETRYNHLNIHTCAVCILYTESVMFRDLQVLNNDAFVSGMTVLTSGIRFRGMNNLFYNNSNKNGGGIFINGATLLLLDQPNVLVHFEANSATSKGGGIYIPSSYLGCFYYAVDTSSSRLSFHNNTAGLVGSGIYGNLFEVCNTSILEYKNRGNSEPVITSRPIRVCLCENGQSQCHVNNTRLSAMPGETISVYVTLVGEQNSPSIGYIYVIYQENHNIWKHNHTECTQVDIRISVKDKLDRTVIFNFSAEVPTPTSELVVVEVQIDPCPFGFELSNKTGMCVCSSKFLYDNTYNIDCDVAAGTITRQGDIWIGTTSPFENATSDDCITIERCPQGFCKSDTVTITANDFDAQCNNNRGGWLCGNCKEGHSLIIGSNSCKKCENNRFLSLIIVFAIGGILLTFEILLLNFTVAMATANGIIFWANIVQLYESIFFPDGKNIYIQFFLYHFNLDFGIPTCFLEEMNACLKLALQFVYPIYLWIIMGITAFICHYSKRASNVLSPRIVPSLTTLMLLSYYKLVRIVILVLYRKEANCGESEIIYWYYSPDIGYLGLCHSILLAVSIGIITFLIIPYTTYLLIFPLCERFERLQKLKCIRICIAKLKPFHDAYGGPYSNEFRFWVGLLLLVRLVLALVVSLSDNNDASLSVLSITCIVLILLLSTGYVYHRKRHPHIHIFDIWTLLSLFLMAFFSAQNSDISEVITTIIASLNVLVYIVLLCYHFYKYFWCVLVERYRDRSKTKMTTNIELSDQGMHKDSTSEPDKQFEPRIKTILRTYSPSRFRDSALNIINN